MKKNFLNLAAASLIMLSQSACVQTNPTSTGVVATTTPAGSTSSDAATHFLKKLMAANNLSKPILNRAMESLQQANQRSQSQLADTLHLSQSTEGGMALVFRKDGALFRVYEQNFGESFSDQTAWYLNGNLPVYVYERISLYNRPFYYDSAQMKENGDNEVFQPERSKIMETGYFFEQGKLLLWVVDSSGVVTVKDHQLQSEEARLMEQLKQYNSK